MTTREFEKAWVIRIEKELLKKFPDEFIGLSDTTTQEMPKKILTVGSEFFGNYEIVDSDGAVHFKTDNYHKVKYLLYSNRTKPAAILIPNSEQKIKSAVREYERLLDSILHEIERDYRRVFPNEKNFPRVSNRIFSSLNLQRY